MSQFKGLGRIGRMLRLAGRQAQARHQQLSVFRVAERRDARHDSRCDGPQSLDDLSRVVKPAHMRITGRENAVGHRPARCFFQHHQQLCCRVVKTPIKEVGDTDHDETPPSKRISRAEAQGRLGMFDRDVGFAGVRPEPAAQIPTAGGSRRLAMSVR